MSNYNVGDVVDLEWKSGKNAGKKCGRAKIIEVSDVITVRAITSSGHADGRKGAYSLDGVGVRGDYNTDGKKIRGLSKDQYVIY